MARTRSLRFLLADLTILLPLRGSADATCIDAGTGKIQVLVQNPLNHDCEAEVSHFIFGSGVGPPIDKQRLVRMGTSPFYQAFLDVGTISGTPTVNNRVIEVTDLIQGEGEKYPIRVIDCGSGSGSLTLLAAHEQARPAHWPAGQPIPVELLLQLDAPVRPGLSAGCEQLNRPTVLTHAQGREFTCCWVSQPLDFCGGARAEPGWWMLQRADARTWTLRLRYQNQDVVTYQLRTAADNDCRLPIRLKRAGQGGPECTSWPATVTITPAP